MKVECSCPECLLDAIFVNTEERYCVPDLALFGNKHGRDNCNMH